ncbi:MAG: CDP-archaeol synthase [Candidatus Andersenbacteria bacterium]
MLLDFGYVIIAVLWFFLPALVANIAPVLAARYRWLPRLAYPLDGYRIITGERILGDNKTMRGLIMGLLFGSVTGLLQYFGQVLVPEPIVLLPHPGFAFFWGAWLALGALLGDALKSFIKRRRYLAPGKSWIPFDQIDVVIGVLLLTQWWQPLTLLQIIVALVVVGIAMYITSVLGVTTKIKKSL